MMTRTKIQLISFCLLLTISSISSVWSRSVETQAVLAVLTLNVARFTSWPEHAFDNPDASLNLCIFGGNVVQQSFVNIDNKVINNKTIHIINLSRLRNLNQCQLLYLSELDRSRLTPLLAELQGLPVLTIGENIAFLEAGGMVALAKVNGKIQLTINLPMLKQCELVISSRLLKLAKIVDFPMPAH